MIVFRADGNSSIGLGHVMRCLSVADAFNQVGKNCMFVTADDEVHNVINKRGYTVLSLDCKYNLMENELNDFEKALDSRKVDAIFVDSYFVTNRYLKGLENFCAYKKITLVYIDDIIAFPYPCDILLNYNIYAKEEDYKKLYRHFTDPVLLIGTQYTPQRTEFQNLYDRKVKEEAKDILVSTGGADSMHIGLEIVKTIIAHPEWKDYRFHFVIGMMNSDKYKMKSLSKEFSNIFLYYEVEKMSELMRLCDVSISAAGSTLYELCSTQTPAITYIIADNQVLGAKGFEDAKILQCAGDVRNIGTKELALKLVSAAISLCNDFSKRQEIAKKMKIVVDGKGTDRIVKTVLKFRKK